MTVTPPNAILVYEIRSAPGAFIVWEIPQTQTSWARAEIWRSIDGGENYTELAEVTDITQGYYFDIDGITDYYYKIRFTDSGDTKQSSYSAAGQPGDWTNKTELYVSPQMVRRFMQLQATVPSFLEIVNDIWVAQMQVDKDIDTNVVSTLRLATIYKASEMVAVSIASRNSLKYGTSNMNVNGQSIQLSFNEAMTLAEYYDKKYKELMAGEVADEGGVTSFLDVVDSDIQQDIIDILHGTSDGFDFQNQDMRTIQNIRSRRLIRSN